MSESTPSYDASYVASLRAQLAQLAQEKDREDTLSNGTFFSKLDVVWKKVDIDIESLEHTLFVRGHNVVDIKKRYEQTVKAAIGNSKEDTGMNENNDAPSDVLIEDAVQSSAAFSSDRSQPFTLRMDIFGELSPAAHSAHLLPHAPVCASYWYPVIFWVLSIHAEEETLTWDIMQKCIHGTNKTGTNTKIPSVGIKHFPTNRIRLISQGTYLDTYPCVIIVPIMTLKEVKEWQGKGYSAIVLAGDWTYKDGNEPVQIMAAKAYMDIQAFGKMRKNDHFANYLAKEDECNKACLLMKQFILSVTEAFNRTTGLHENLKGKETTYEIRKFTEWKSNFRVIPTTAPVPVSNDWDDDKMKIRKITFSDSDEIENPAPDPALLLAKGASTWLKRHEFAILPGCGDGDTDDSTDSVISFREEARIRGWLYTPKKPCIAEVNINVHGDDVEEPLSDDESLCDT